MKEILGQQNTKPLIVVHPYWLLGMYNLKFSDYDTTEPEVFMQQNKLEGTPFGQDYYSYLQTFEETIPSYPGPLITLETTRRFLSTKERYEYLNRKHESYFIKTNAFDSIPKEGWIELFELLDCNFGAKKILLAGGSYSRHLKNPGCLGLAEEVLLKYEYRPTVLKGLHYLLDWKWMGDKVELLQK